MRVPFLIKPNTIEGSERVWHWRLKEGAAFDTGDVGSLHSDLVWTQVAVRAMLLGARTLWFFMWQSSGMASRDPMSGIAYK